MQISVKTHARTQMIDITAQVREAVRESGIQEGLVHVCSMHTTGAVTINENADPAVETDILACINKVIPWDDGFKHMEGNSAAHIKSSLVGVSSQLPITGGRLMLGTWQGIFFCEFDGPRSRKVHLRMMAGK